MFNIGDKVKLNENYSEIGIQKTKERKANSRYFAGEENYWNDVKLDTQRICTILSIDKDGDIVLNYNDELEFYKEQLIRV